MNTDSMGYALSPRGDGRKVFLLAGLFTVALFMGAFLFAGTARAIVNNPPSFDAIANQNVNEDSSTQDVIITNVSDGDGGQTVTMSAASSNTSIVPNPSVSGVGASRTLSYTPAADQNGIVTITVTADDGQIDNNTFQGSFSITVNAVNDPPSFDPISNQSVEENSSTRNVSITNVSPGASNESAQTVTLTAVSDNPTLIPNPSVSGSGASRTLSYAPATNQTGTATITVTADDGQASSNTSSRMFSITVNEDTTPPSMSVSDPAANGSYTNDNTPSFTFSAGDASTIECKMDSDSFSACTSPFTASTLSDGSHTFTASSSDLAGNSASVSRQLTVDTIAPSVSSVAFSPTSGTRKIGDTITLTINADSAGYTAGAISVNGVAVTGFTDAGGGVYAATYTVASGNTDRADTDQIPVSVVLTDAAGNSNSAFTTSPSADNSPAIDANAPSAPSAPDLVPSSDTGSSDTDNITNFASPTVTLTAEAGSSIKIYDTDGTTIIGLGDPTDGTYTIGVSTLSDGAHSITAKATDAAGNVSAASGALSVTIDTSAPSAPSTPDLDAASDSGSNTDNITSDNTPTLSGTAEANSTVKIYDGGSTLVGTGSANGSGNWSITASSLSDGAHSITAKATDAAGNVSDAGSALSVTIDTSAPVISSLALSPNSGYAKIGDAVTLTITADASGYSSGVITVNGAAVTGFTDNTDNTYSVTYTVNSGDTDRVAGTTPASVVLNDAAGNTSTAFTSVSVNTLKIDAHAPTLVSARTTSTTTIDLTFSEDLLGTTVTNNDFAVSGHTLTTPDAFEFTPGVVRLSVADAFSGADTPEVNYTGMVEDLAGNAAPVAGPLTPADGVAPDAPSEPDLDGGSDSGLSSTDNVTNSTTPTFTGTAEAGATVKIYNGDTEIGSGTAGEVYSIIVSALSDGAHSITAKATDAAGNESAASSALVVTIDTVAPETPVISSIAGNNYINADETGAVIVVGTAEADSKVDVYLEDGDGNSTDTGSEQLTDGATAFSVVLDDSGLSEGTITPTVTATDQAGNVSDPTNLPEATKDTSAPTLNSVSIASNNSNSAALAKTGDFLTLSFTSNEDLVTPTVTIAGHAVPTSGGPTVWSSGYTMDSGDVEGAVSFSIDFSDLAGNAGFPVAGTTDASEVIFDQTAPVLSGLADDLAPAQSKTWVWAATDAVSTPTFRFVIDQNISGAPEGEYGSAVTATKPDGDGTYYLHVQARDAAGNESAVTTVSAILDNTAPEAPIITTPIMDDDYVNNTEKTAVVIAGTAEADSLVSISISDGSASVSSTQQLSDGDTAYSQTFDTSILISGTLNVSVTATDAAGNVSAAGTATVTKDTAAPNVVISTGSSDGAFVNTPALPFAGTTEAGATVRFYDTDGTTVIGSNTASGVNWSVTTSSLTDGAHAITAKATDVAGNVGSVTTARSITIDTVSPAAAINGPSSITLYVGQNYTDPGASATDETDGDITGSVSSDWPGDNIFGVSGTTTITYSVSDRAGNSGQTTRTVEVMPVSENQNVMTGTSATLSSAAPEVVFSSANTSTSTVSVPSNVTNATLNMGTLVSANSLTIPAALNIDAATPLGAVAIQIPAGMTLTASTTGSWSGIINLPQIKSNSSVSPAPTSGNTVSVSSAIEIGLNDTVLIFDKAVRVSIAGQAGKLVGYSRGGEFTQITSACSADSQAAGNALPAAGECSIDVGSDKVIWTKHFTTFSTYSLVPVSVAVAANGPIFGGGGGGGGGGGPFFPPTSVASAAAAPVTQTVQTVQTTQTTGQVLGAATYNFTKSLSSGSRGVEVAELQKRLIKEGFLQGEATGYFGIMTREALKAFQAKNGLPPVGAVGPQTRKILNQGALPATPAGSGVQTGEVQGVSTYNFTKSLSSGSRGVEVAELQKRLIKEGFLQGEATGYFGIMTREALKAFQAKNNLPPVGSVGPATRALLNQGGAR